MLGRARLRRRQAMLGGRMTEGLKVALLVEGALVLALFVAFSAIWGH